MTQAGVRQLPEEPREGGKSRSTSFTMRRAAATAVTAIVVVKTARQAMRCCRLVTKGIRGSQMPIKRSKSLVSSEGFLLVRLSLS